MKVTSTPGMVMNFAAARASFLLRDSRRALPANTRTRGALTVTPSSSVIEHAHAAGAIRDFRGAHLIHAVHHEGTVEDERSLGRRAAEHHQLELRVAGIHDV